MKKLFAIYNKLFAAWVVLFGVVAYFFPKPFEFLSQWNKTFFALTMFGIGAVLEPEAFQRIIRNPLNVFIGTAAQFIIMPLGAFAAVRLLNIEDKIAVGLIIAGCVPGAMASNVMSYIARADAAYSVSLTTVSTLLCPLLTPFLVKILAGAIIPVEFWPMFKDIIMMVVLPLSLGFLVRYVFKDNVEKIAQVFPAISVTFIVFICSIVVARNRESLLEMHVVLLFAVVLLNVYGMAAGYGVGRLFKMPVTSRRTLSIEIGMQNAGLGTVLALDHFGARSAIPTALFVFICIFTASLMAEVWRRREPAVLNTVQ